MPARRQFSHSRLTLLDQCPRQYRFRYVERRPEAFRSIEAFCGTLVHEVLGWLYEERERDASPDADAAIDRFRATWSEKLSPDVRVIREPVEPVVAGDPREAYREDAEEILRTHHAGRFQRDRRETLAIESRVALDVGGHAYMGYVDRLARDRDGALHVVDFKTSRQIPRDSETMAQQVRGYGAAVLETHGGTEVKLELDFVRHDEQVTETLERASVGAVAQDLEQRIEKTLAAEDADDFPARPSRLCAWCGHRAVCDASEYYEGPRPEPRGAEPGPCPDCGRALRLRHGRRGPFIGCTGYPECRHARNPTPQELPPRRGDGETTCPLCGGELRRRSGRRGDFLGCSGYPECRFTRDAADPAG